LVSVPIFGEHPVPAVTRESSLDPSEFGPTTARVGHGLLALTAWGQYDDDGDFWLDGPAP
jgi:hypothetical protein